MTALMTEQWVDNGAVEAEAGELEHGEGNERLDALEAVSEAGEETDLGVPLLDDGIAEADVERGLYPWSEVPDRPGQLPKGDELTSLGRADPARRGS